jgi:AcrR family transcriptional regulator
LDLNSNQGARERLLEGAIDTFGRHGYEAATTRMIAAEAGVNIAAIPYYFGGKEGLYRAVISRIVDIVRAESGGILENLETLSWRSDNERDLALSKLQHLIEKLISLVIGSAQGERIARIILREQMYPSSAYDLIYSGFMEPILETITALVMAASGESSERRAKLRALTIIGQVLVFRVARETIVRSLALQGYDREEVEQIRQIIIGQTQAVLSLID